VVLRALPCHMPAPAHCNVLIIECVHDDDEDDDECVHDDDDDECVHCTYH
jgi:hypothetical protein